MNEKDKIATEKHEKHTAKYGQKETTKDKIDHKTRTREKTNEKPRQRRKEQSDRSGAR